MPIGMGILLRNNESGYFLGDVKWGANNAHNGFGVLTRCVDNDGDDDGDGVYFRSTAVMHILYAPPSTLY